MDLTTEWIGMAAVQYVIKKRLAGKCCGCGQCDNQTCPRIVKYRKKVAGENSTDENAASLHLKGNN